ncbi:transmembrane protein 245-like isoform X1 [Montipora foliosa]|uniref:transmembrane protein 245-like isoform X1 n=1 Tax=Montipora foliosa TaxID=591990 RepID=UPI0035F1A7BB
MASLRPTRRQASMDALSSPFSAVFTSVGVQQNEKALKLAFYNTAALVFVALSGCTAVGVYYVMEPFLRPLLWAGLCGAFLYPFKWKLTQIVRGFLRSLRESNTPLVVGATLVPFQLANRFSDFVGSFVVHRIRIFILVFVLTTTFYGLYIIQPFNEIFWILKRSGVVVNLLLDLFNIPYLVWSITIGYILIVVFFWTPNSASFISFFSLPVWIMFLLHLVSLTQSYRIPFFLLLVVCSIVGFLTSGTEESDQVDGAEDWKKKRQRFFRDLSQAAVALQLVSSTAIPNSESDESIEKPQKEPSVVGSSQVTATTATDSTDGRDFVEGKPLPNRRRGLQRTKQKSEITKEGDYTSKSNLYFEALFWGILLSRLWLYAELLMILMIPILFYALKQLLSYWSSSISSSALYVLVLRWWAKVRSWANERKKALVPMQLSGLFKGGIKVDLMINSIMDSSMENIISIFMVFFLIVACSLITVFFAVQVHHESAQIVSVSANLVNKVMADNPQLVNWIQENKELKNTIEQSIDRAYIDGRQFLAAKVQSMFGDANSSALQEEVLDLTDRIYNAWINWGNSSATKGGAENGTITAREIPKNINVTAVFSGTNMMNLLNLFDVRVLVSLIRENLGTLLSLLESVWIFLKGNVSFAFNFVTTVLSIVFFSGAYVLNTGLSMIIFVTALFYLLSISGEQYKPVEWFSKVTATGTSGFSDSAYGAIRGVFGAAVKMATFYGVYTWFTHTTFGVNIVYIPSAFAAVTAVVPFIGTYWAAAPAVLEIWLVQGDGILAIVLAVCHLLPTYFVDVAIYSEISGGGHPYLTGLAVAGGIYCIGLEGAIVGPIVLCCLIVACNVYSNMLGDQNPVPLPVIHVSSDSQEKIDDMLPYDKERVQALTDT